MPGGRPLGGLENRGGLPVRLAANSQVRTAPHRRGLGPRGPPPISNSLYFGSRLHFGWALPVLVGPTPPQPLGPFGGATAGAMGREGGGGGGRTGRARGRCGRGVERAWGKRPGTAWERRGGAGAGGGGAWGGNNPLAANPTMAYGGGVGWPGSPPPGSSRPDVEVVHRVVAVVVVRAGPGGSAPWCRRRRRPPRASWCFQLQTRKPGHSPPSEGQCHGHARHCAIALGFGVGSGRVWVGFGVLGVRGPLLPGGAARTTGSASPERRSGLRGRVGCSGCVLGPLLPGGAARTTGSVSPERRSGLWGRVGCSGCASGPLLPGGAARTAGSHRPNDVVASWGAHSNVSDHVISTLRLPGLLSRKRGAPLCREAQTPAEAKSRPGLKV